MYLASISVESLDDHEVKGQSHAIKKKVGMGTFVVQHHLSAEKLVAWYLKEVIE